MTIYSTSVLDYDQPAEKLEKRQRKRKVDLPTQEELQANFESQEPKTKKRKSKVTLPSPPASNSSVDQADQPKPKKERTPAQLAAFEKAKETRQRKKEEAQALAKQNEEAILAKQQEITNKEAEIAAKKAASAEKRRLAREAKKVDKQVDELVDGKSDDDTKPPKWFKNYVQSTRVQEAKDAGELRHPKEVEKSANQEAKTKWEDGLVRDRVTHERNNHHARMYATIFGRQM